IIMAYEDKIVMEPTFDEALDKMMAMVDPEDGKEPPEEEPEADEEAPEDEESEEPIIEGEEMIREFANLFDQYQQALSEGDWEKAAEIMTSIEDQLEGYK